MRDALGIEGLEISIGDTPGCTLSDGFEGIDELRPGNYVYYDVMQMDLGTCRAEEIALGVACPVISKHPERGDVVVHGENEHVLAPVFGRAADGFDRGRGDGRTDEADTLVTEIGFDVIGVVEAHAAIPE